MLYVLTNLVEVQPFIRYVLNELVSFRHMSLFRRPTPLFLVGTGNFFVNPGMDQGNLPRKKMIPFFHGVQDQGAPISFVGSNRKPKLMRL